MSHCIDMSRGAFVDAPAWWDHDSAKVVEHFPGMTLRDLAEKGNMLHRINKVPAEVTIWTPEGSRTVEVPNQHHLVRSDDQRVVSPSTVTDRYGVMEPELIVNQLDVYVNAGFARPDACFSLYEGQSDVFTLRMLDAAGPLGENWRLYFVVQDFHGGMGACRGKVTGIRVVCNNTATAAFGAGADWRVRHGSQASLDLVLAMQEWEEATAAIERFNAAAERMARSKVQIPATVDILLGLNEKEKKVTPQLQAKRDDLIARADDPDNGTVGESLWDVYNAVTSFNTHNDSGKGAKTAMGRFVGSLNGSRYNFERKAFETLVALIPDGI